MGNPVNVKNVHFSIEIILKDCKKEKIVFLRKIDLMLMNDDC